MGPDSPPPGELGPPWHGRPARPRPASPRRPGALRGESAARRAQVPGGDGAGRPAAGASRAAALQLEERAAPKKGPFPPPGTCQ
jgi:hypothetical protein